MNLDLVEESIERLTDLIGGRRLEGKVVDPSGAFIEGQLLVYGPSSYFVSTDNAMTGILQLNPGTIEPKLVPFKSAQAIGTASVIESGVGSLTLDPSFSALKLRKARGTVLEHVQKGGWVGYIIMLLGFTTVVLSVAKVSDLHRLRPRSESNFREMARSAVTSEPAKAPEGQSSDYVYRLLRAGVENARRDIALLEENLLSVILEYRLRLERFLPILATTAATAPLLGLLGTVVGMIKTFTLITIFGTGDAKSLSSGISEALVTTELGLIIAVPALVLHGAFQRAIKSRTNRLESMAFEFINTVETQTKAR